MGTVESAAPARRSPASMLVALAPLFEDHETQWSMGTFGAIAEFMRDPDEPAIMSSSSTALSIATARGALRLEVPAPEVPVRLVAYETVSRHANLWRQAVAMCLPEDLCEGHGRGSVTELGHDSGAVRPEDREAVLFDLGLGLRQTDACIRTRDPGLLRALRASEGRALFAADNPVLMHIMHAGPHRVFLSQLGRIEVFQPIPPSDGTSPLGPHTHILPKLLRAQRTHVATAPIPAGWVPCAMLYPAHPILDAQGEVRSFAPNAFASFARLLDLYGLPDLVAVQRETVARVRDGSAPRADFARSKFQRAALRVALRKLRASEPALPALPAWLAACDRGGEDDGDEETQHAC